MPAFNQGPQRVCGRGIKPDLRLCAHYFRKSSNRSSERPPLVPFCAGVIADGSGLQERRLRFRRFGPVKRCGGVLLDAQAFGIHIRKQRLGLLMPVLGGL